MSSRVRRVSRMPGGILVGRRRYNRQPMRSVAEAGIDFHTYARAKLHSKRQRHGPLSVDAACAFAVRTRLYFGTISSISWPFLLPELSIAARICVATTPSSWARLSSCDSFILPSSFRTTASAAATCCRPTSSSCSLFRFH